MFFLHFFASLPIISAFIPAQIPGHSLPVEGGRIQGEQQRVFFFLKIFLGVLTQA